MIEEEGLIYLDNVSKAYSTGAPALNGVTLHIARGEFVFIVGDSGSGKSTLIKLLLRELTATQGKIYVMGHDLAKLKHGQIPKYRRHLGVVFQDFRLLKDRNVYENVAFAQRIIEKSGKEIRRNVPSILSTVVWQENIRQNRSNFPVVNSRELLWRELWLTDHLFCWLMNLQEI